RLLSRLQGELAVTLPLAALFTHSTLTALAESIAEQSREVLEPIAPVPRDGPLALSFAQERMWFLARLGGASVVYNIPFARRLQGPLDAAAWRGSLDTLFARHE